MKTIVPTSDRSSRKRRSGDRREAGGTAHDIPRGVLQALKEGNHDAYDEVYIRYRDPIYNFLKILTRSDVAAEEIAQEVFVNVWEKRDKINPAKNIKSYLYTIARNAALQYFNRQKVHGRFTDFSAAAGNSESVSSEELVIAKETEILIEIALSRMPAQRRRVFEMSHYEGLSNEIIAEQLEISKSNVTSHLSNARKDIKEVLALFILLFIASH